MAAEEIFYATGKRKTSAARVFMRSGTGKVMINKRPMDDFLKTPSGRASIQTPFQATGTAGQFDLYVTVKGGGTTGQAEAIRHGISRALLAVNEEYRAPLKLAGYLTRDSRMVERKKYGRHKARRSSQFSKR